jgi:hypothetical protein
LVDADSAVELIQKNAEYSAALVTALIARAEAAEAVVAAVRATLQRASDHGNGLDQFQVEDVLAALAAPAVSHPEPTEEAHRG